MKKTKPSASLVVPLAVALFAASLLLPAVPAAAAASRFEQQDAQTVEPQAEPERTPDRSWGEQVVEAVFEILADLIRGPGSHPGGPDDGDQGASLDPSGYRLSKH